MENFKLSRYVVEVPFFDKATQQRKHLIFSTRSSKMRAISERLWGSLRDCCFHDISPNIVQDLKENHFIVDANENELEKVLSENNEAIRHHKELYFVIQPTKACPLGCGYCGQKHSSKSMTPDVQTSLLKRIQRKIETGSYASLRIAWFGAEPLSGMTVIDDLSPKIQQLAASYNLKYSARIVTNGLLLSDEIAKRLINDYAVSFFEITLDGLSVFHDARRFLKTGGPSFDKIYSNLKNLAHLETPPAISIRCNVDERNYKGVSPLIQQLAADKLQDFVTFYVAPIHSWGNDAHLLSAEKKKFSRWEIDWLIELQELGFRVSFLPKRKEMVCFAVKEDAELIDPSGGIYGCSEVSLVPSYELDGQNTHKLGKVNDDILHNKDSRKPFLTFYNTETLHEYGCATCNMLPTCGGGCPKEWFEGRSPCPSTKFNIKERMLLHYVSKH